MSVNIPASIFREYDIRGIAERDLSADFAQLLGRAYAQLLVGQKPQAGRARPTVAVGGTGGRTVVA